MDTSLVVPFIHPGQVLFALTVLLFGSAFTLSFLLSSKPDLARVLNGVLLVILFLLLGTVAIEFSAASTPSYTFGSFASLSEALATHRWLLFILPIVLTMVSTLVLSVYHDRIAQKQSRLYRAVVLINTAVSFAAVLVIAVESLL